MIYVILVIAIVIAIPFIFIALVWNSFANGQAQENLSEGLTILLVWGGVLGGLFVTWIALAEPRRPRWIFRALLILGALIFVAVVAANPVASDSSVFTMGAFDEHRYVNIPAWLTAAAMGIVVAISAERTTVSGNDALARVYPVALGLSVALPLMLATFVRFGVPWS